MTRNTFYAISLVLSVVFFFSSCKKKEEPNPGTSNPPAKQTATLALEFSNQVDGASLQLNGEWYSNANGDSFQVTRFNYYISNIKLHGSDGTVFAEPESYHLLRQENPESLKFSIENVPNGVYTGISFLIGVDSIRNVSGVQTGALDPAHGMFWDWNSGYIMAKFEANSPQSPNGKVLYHVGGFSGENNTLKEVHLSLPTSLYLSNNLGVILIEADAAEWLKNPHLIDFSELHTIHMPNGNAKKIADNYADMFRVGAVTSTIE